MQTTVVDLVICEPIGPDATAFDGSESELVDTTMPAMLSVARPMVRPCKVTVTAVLAASVVPAVVMTMEVAVGAATLPVAPLLMATAGVALVAKKPDGYDSVILLPAASAPPAVVVNENVATAPGLPATRSPTII